MQRGAPDRTSAGWRRPMTTAGDGVSGLRKNVSKHCHSEWSKESRSANKELAGLLVAFGSSE